VPVLSFSSGLIHQRQLEDDSLPTQADIRQDITNRIVAALKQDLLPWRKPWSTSPNSGRAANFTSGKNYSGVNPLLLDLHRINFDLRSRFWGTYRQWEAKGGMVKKRPADVLPGHWGCRIVFAKPVTKTKEKDGKEVEDKFFMLRTFTVFNADQVEGEFADSLQVNDEEPTVVPNFEPADELMKRPAQTFGMAASVRSTAPPVTTFRCRTSTVSTRWAATTSHSFTNLLTGVKAA